MININMIFGIITLASALLISSIAAYFSVSGLAAIFASTFLPVILMGGALEAGKLVSVVWLHRNWRTKNYLLKYGLCVAVFILMCITSLGIFGFLSKGHVEQDVPVRSIELRIERTQEQISNLKTEINQAQSKKQQLDSIIQTLVEYDKISGPDGAKSVRKDQEQERKLIQTTISRSYDQIEKLQQKRSDLKNQISEIQAKLGPIQYISEILFENSEDNIDNAVRVVIIMLIITFDPLAVLLLIAANHTFISYNQKIPFIEENEYVQTEKTPEFEKQTYDNSENLENNLDSEEQNSYSSEREKRSKKQRPKHHTDPDAYRRILNQR